MNPRPRRKRPAVTAWPSETVTPVTTDNPDTSRTRAVLDFIEKHLHDDEKEPAILGAYAEHIDQEHKRLLRE